MTRFARRFRRVGRTLSRVELMHSSMDETFAIDGLGLLDKNAGRRFLDFYGDEGLTKGFEAYGFYDALRRRGFDDFRIETHAQDERHTMILDARSGEERHRLMDLVVRRDRLAIQTPEDAPSFDRTFDVLTVDWLSLRNPVAAFTAERMRLPGQEAPGLGVGERVMELLYRVVDRLGLDGLVTVAEYFHNAVLYARELPYVDPFYQGQLLALEDLLYGREKLGFAQATWAMHWGLVNDVDDSVVRWRGEAMVRAMNSSLKKYIESRAHAARADRARRTLRYRLDRTAFEERWRSEEPSLLRFPEGPGDLLT